MATCPTPELSAATRDYAGGTAYDPRVQTVWTSDGVSITRHALDTCNLICTGSANRVLGSNSAVSGLSVHNGTLTLYQLETLPGQYAVVVYDIQSGILNNCFRFLSGCASNTLSTSGVAGGIACDEARNCLYVAISEPDGNGFRHYIRVSSRSAPCTEICRYELTGFDATRILTGLTCESANTTTLHVTNGVKHLEIAVGDPKKCEFTPGQTCDATDFYRGLSLIPGWELKRFGKSCLPAPCPTCPEMRMKTFGGDPAIGSRTFGVEVTDGPGGSLAILYIRVDKCSPAIPLLCGEVFALTPLAPFHLPLIGPACTGNARLFLPIPSDLTLAGLPVCMQSVIACAPGLGLTGAIEFSITGS